MDPISPCIIMTCKQHHMLRISKLFHNIVEMGAENGDRCEVFMRGLSDLRDMIDKSVCKRNEPID